jgi:lipoprotein-releasing system permease protein
MRPEERQRRAGGGEDLDAYLRGVDLAWRGGRTDEVLEAEDVETSDTIEDLDESPSPPPAVTDDEAPTDDLDDAPIVLPTVVVPTPEQAEAALAGAGDSSGTGVLPDEVQAGDVVPTESLPGVVVGRSLATELDISVGDRVRIVSPLAGFSSSLFGSGTPGTPRSRELRVIGIFEAGFDEYDTELVYADLFEAEQFFDHGDAVDGVEIRLHDPSLAPMISRRLEQDLGGGAYHTMDWEELNHNLFTALEIQKVMLSLVIASIVFVAAFTVIATLIMIVLEKKREIAILKAMGAKDFSILTVFLIQGTVVGVIGTAMFGPANPRWDHLKDQGAWAIVPRATLVAVLVLFGFFPSLIIDLIHASLGSR